jgi:hypothetical protein
MSPFRWDVLLVGFVLALPVLALGMRGDFTTEEMLSRLPWCLVAGWGVVALLRYATTPRGPHRVEPRPDPLATAHDPATDSEHSPAS